MPEISYIETTFATAVGVLVAMVYFFQKGLCVFSVRHLKNGQKLSVNEPFLDIFVAYVCNVVLAFLVVWVFYQAKTAQQFGFASLSVVGLLSGHMSFDAFRKQALGEGSND